MRAPVFVAAVLVLLTTWTEAHPVEKRDTEETLSEETDYTAGVISSEESYMKELGTAGGDKDEPQNSTLQVQDEFNISSSDSNSEEDHPDQTISEGSLDQDDDAEVDEAGVQSVEEMEEQSLNQDDSAETDKASVSSATEPDKSSNQDEDYSEESTSEEKSISSESDQSSSTESKTKSEADAVACSKAGSNTDVEATADGTVIDRNTLYNTVANRLCTLNSALNYMATMTCINKMKTLLGDMNACMSDTSNQEKMCNEAATLANISLDTCLNDMVQRFGIEGCTVQQPVECLDESPESNTDNTSAASEKGPKQNKLKKQKSPKGKKVRARPNGG